MKLSAKAITDFAILDDIIGYKPCDELRRQKISKNNVLEVVICSEGQLAAYLNLDVEDSARDCPAQRHKQLIRFIKRHNNKILLRP